MNREEDIYIYIMMILISLLPERMNMLPQSIYVRVHGQLRAELQVLILEYQTVEYYTIYIILYYSIIYNIIYNNVFKY